MGSPPSRRGEEEAAVENGILGALDFDARLARADAVVSGEGRFDSQSLEGKIVGAIADRCATAAKPLHLIVGQNSLGADLARST